MALSSTLSVAGHAVKQLTSHGDKNVSQLARRVISSWKNHFEEKQSKPSLDVRCDHATTESRTTVRRHITAALLADSEDELAASVCHSTLCNILPRDN